MKMNKMNAVAYGLLVLVFLLWGSLYVVSSQVLQQLPSFTVLFLRFFIAWIFLSIVSGLKKDKPRRIAAEDRKYLYMLAIGGYTAAVGLQLIGVKLVGSTTASLINAMNPVFISIFAVFLLKEKLTFNKVLGIVYSTWHQPYLTQITSVNYKKTGSVLVFFSYSLLVILYNDTDILFDTR